MFEAVTIASLVLAGINTAITVDAYGRTIQSLTVLQYAAQRPELIKQTKTNARNIGIVVSVSRYCRHPLGDRLYRAAIAEVTAQNIPAELKTTFHSTLERTIATNRPTRASVERAAKKGITCESQRAGFDQTLANIGG